LIFIIILGIGAVSAYAVRRVSPGFVAFLFITWDEAGTGDGPIGMIVLSPFAKGNGYQNTTHYTHGSTLRTFEEIFGVSPFLGDAANETDLSDLFASFP
jgi:hypothetical protein